LPQQAGHKNHVWAWDFVSDYTERGGRLRTFNLIDVYTRECHCIHADRTINYNHERPHRSLGLQTPAAFAKNQGVQGSGSSRATPSLHRNLDETDKPKPPETIS
jgi:transposase InsO family protein